MIEQLKLCYEYADDVETTLELRQSYWNEIENKHAIANRLLSSSDTMKICKRIAIGFTALMAFAVMSSNIWEDSSLESITTAVSMIAVPLILTVLFWVKQKSKMREHLQAKQEAEEYAVYIQDQIRICEEDITETIEEIQDRGLFEIMPKDYFGTECIAYCIKLFENKLVTNMHEAMVALHNEIQRQEQYERQDAYYNMHMEKMDDLKRAVDINTMVTWIESQNNKQ